MEGLGETSGSVLRKMLSIEVGSLDDRVLLAGRQGALAFALAPTETG